MRGRRESAVRHPPLPDGHTRAVNALGFGVQSKSYFRLNRRTWNVENAFTCSSARSPAFGRGGSPCRAPRAQSCWLSTPVSGRSVESSSPDDLMTSALPIARRLFGDDVSQDEVRTSNWTVDPYARGAYSFHAPGSGLDDLRRLREPIGDRLYLAGEAVGVDNPATVTSAVVSGRYAAGQLMHRLSG